MQRRQLLKLVLPIALLSAGVVGAIAGRKLLQPDCTALGSSALLGRLKPFSDVELGKKASQEMAAGSLNRLQALCEQGFDQHYRQLVQGDFAEQRLQKIDGWILSQTEGLTHLAVSRPVVLSGALPAGG